MKKSHLIGLGVMLVITAIATAQYGDEDRRRYQRRDEQQLNFFQKNWGFREEDGLLRRLRLSRDQERDIRRLQMRTQGQIDEVTGGHEHDRRDFIRRDEKGGLPDIVDSYHRELRRIFNRDQNVRFTNLWQDEMRRHRNWWTWQFDIEKRIAGRLHLDRDQRNRFNDLNREVGHRVDEAIDEASDDSARHRDRENFSYRIKDAMGFYHSELLRILDPRQRDRFESELRRDSMSRSEDEKFRAVWVFNI